MIIHALKEYYERLAAAPDANMALPGWEQKEIPYIVVISKDGKLERIECTYEGNGKARRAKNFLVPKGIKRSSGIASNLLWDNPAYALGIGPADKADRLIEQHSSFKRAIECLPVDGDEGISALLKFLNRETKLEELAAEGALYEELLESGANMTFRIAGDPGIISSRPKVKAAVEEVSHELQTRKGICLITGEADAIARLHTAIKGVWGAQSSGASLVAFNSDSFQSFNKKQGENAPIGEKAEFAYTTALNHLLHKDSTQRLQVGDASTVFWTSKESEFETQIAEFFSEPSKDNPERNTRAVAALLDSVRTGAYIAADKDTRCYVLGLAPNAARIAVRFWDADTVPRMAARFAQHFEDLEIARSPRDPATLSLFRLLVAIAPQGKADNIPPTLAGDTMRAILSGHAYPATLLQAAIRRIRADHEIPYSRAALIKATINRALRLSSTSTHPTSEKELLPMLDLENKNIGYRLGRLFATLEKIQSEAQKSLNATIRDRYYGAASGTPVSVFGTLMRLKNHHLAKLEPGRRVNIERLLGEIMSAINDFPPHLSLADQGRFAIGYYHQNQSLYTKN